jgi:hypothetical protein
MRQPVRIVLAATYTGAPLASSISPTQLVAVRGIPVTSSGAPPSALTCGR